MSFADVRTGEYLKDRVYYDQKIFRVTKLAIQGQIQQRDIIIELAATQMKPDELIDDSLFVQWASDYQES